MDVIKSIKRLLQLRPRYLLTLVNEKSLSSVLQVSLRKSTIILAALLLVVLSGAAWYVMFRFTPLRATMPQRIDPALLDDYSRLADRVDSLVYVAEINGRFADNIKAIMTDSINTVQSDTTGTNLYDLPLDSLMEAGQAESRFVKQYESSARYNLSVLSPIAAEGMVFYPPFTGQSLKSNAADTELPSVTINAAAATPVSAIYRGTVIDAYYTTTKGITVLVQHPNNFISQYSGLGDVFVVRGGKVNAGQRIGMSGGERYPLSFMLWHEGTALDPSSYIQMPQTVSVDNQEPFIQPKRRR